MCTFLCSQSNAEEKVIRWFVLMVSVPVFQFPFWNMNEEVSSLQSPTLAPSVFPSQLLTWWLLRGPSHLTGKVSGHTIAVVAATIPALPFPQNWVGLHPPSWCPPQSRVAVQNERQEDWARQLRWWERNWNQEADKGYKPWACQEGHKEQEGWKRRGPTHVINK